MLENIIQVFLENPIGQTVWIIATIVMTYSWTIKDDQKMLYWFTGAMLVWSIHFFILWSMIAGLLYLYMFIRNLFFFKWPRNKWLFIAAAIVPFVILFHTYESHIDIVVTTAPLVFIYGLYFYKWLKLRLSFVIISFIWLYYSWHAQSLWGIATEFIYLGWIAVGIYKVIKGEKKIEEAL
jgi:hypothetical protein